MAEKNSVKKRVKRVTEKPAVGPRVKKAKSARALANQNAKHRDRRTFIMTHAARLFAEKSYTTTSMDDLSAATKLNKSTLYYYYKTKSAILYDMCTSGQVSLLDLITPATKMDSAVDGMTHIIYVLVKWAIQNNLYARIFSQEARHFKSIFSKAEYSFLNERRKKFIEIIYEVLGKGCASGEFRPLDVEETSGFIIGLTFWRYPWPDNEFWQYPWPGHEIDIDSAVASVSEFIFRAIQR